MRTEIFGHWQYEGGMTCNLMFKPLHTFSLSFHVQAWDQTLTSLDLKNTFI